jgi:ABC-2 type transport system permease protein
VRNLDLSTGQVPVDVDVLVVVAPQGMTDTERFAIDQFLMRGGSVVVAAGNYAITTDQFGSGLALRPLEDGMRDMLSSYGIEVAEALVMDPQNEPFPVPVARTVGGVQIQELQAIDYPFFVDVRPDGMASKSPIVSNLSAVTMNWASPVIIDEEKNAGREATILLQSTAGSWTQADTNIQPDFDLYPDLGFPVGSETRSCPCRACSRVCSRASLHHWLQARARGKEPLMRRALSPLSSPCLPRSRSLRRPLALSSLAAPNF